jgi:hypothetical protein
MKTKKTSIPSDSLVRRWLPAGYVDAFACEVDTAHEISPDEIMVAFWSMEVGWVRALFRLRDFLVRFVGLQGAEGMDFDEFKRTIRQGGSYRFMSVAAKNDHETVVLLSDKHLDAWLSVHVADTGTGARRQKKVSAITAVRFKNNLGRLYFFVIRPFHAVIVKTLLERAIKKTIFNRL